jgi:hypothetical protein
MCPPVRSNLSTTMMAADIAKVMASVSCPSIVVTAVTALDRNDINLC